MPRFKEKKKLKHQSSTHEYLHSISSMPHWCRILLNNTEKAYKTFLEFLMDNNFCLGREKAITIKQMALEFGSDTSKITKWLAQIYEDISTLNFDKPELFKAEGLQHELYFKNYDDYFNLNLWLLNTPRIYESFEFTFAKSAVGTSIFYVESVNHSIENNEHRISINLKGGFVNRYRELLIERAEFYGYLSSFRMFDMYDFQVDDELKNIYKE